MSVGSNLQEMENAVTKGAAAAEPMQKLTTGKPDGQPSVEDLGGPTPENYRPDDDSAALKTASSPSLAQVKNVVNKGAKPAEAMPAGMKEESEEVEEDQEIVSEAETTEEEVVSEEETTEEEVVAEATDETEEEVQEETIEAEFSVEEDVNALFAGEELSEEFQDKARTIFETAIKTKVEEVKEQIQSQYQEQLVDSLSMFDRLVSFTNSNLTIDEVTSNLNILDYESYFDLSSLIINKDIPGILSMYDKVYNRGVDDVNFLNGISKHFRELLINKLDESDIKDDLKIKYKKQGDDYSDEDLILMIDIVNECLINYQKVNDKRIHTEICLMKLTSLDSIKKKNSLIKTSEFSNKVIEEDNKLDEALEVNKKEIKLFTSNNDEVSSLSIASLNFKKSENIEEEDNIELPNDDFTENDIRMAWKKFCDKEKVNGNNNMLSLLNMNDPVIGNNSIIISTINKMNQKEVKGYKNKIQAFISKELNNYSITVDVSLDEVKQKKNFVDSKDKLDALIKENNNISLLINEFKLRI